MMGLIGIIIASLVNIFIMIYIKLSEIKLSEIKLSESPSSFSCKYFGLVVVRVPIAGRRKQFQT